MTEKPNFQRCLSRSQVSIYNGGADLVKKDSQQKGLGRNIVFLEICASALLYAGSSAAGTSIDEARSAVWPAPNPPLAPAAYEDIWARRRAEDDLEIVGSESLEFDGPENRGPEQAREPYNSRSPRNLQRFHYGLSAAGAIPRFYQLRDLSRQQRTAPRAQVRNQTPPSYRGGYQNRHGPGGRRNTPRNRQ